MASVFDEYAQQYHEERANNERKNLAAKLITDALYPLNKIAELTGLSEQEVAEKVSQERVAEREKTAIIHMLKEGASIEFIARIFPSFSIEDIKQLQQNELVNV